MRNQLELFVTHEDLLSLINKATSEQPLDIYISGLFNSVELTKLDGPEDIKAFHNYLIVDKKDNVQIREVPQRNGTVKYAVDQQLNHYAATLNYGGLYESDHLITSQIGIVNSNSQNERIFKTFKTVILKDFVKVKSYYVGPEADVLLSEGARLTATKKSPSLYDLKRN